MNKPARTADRPEYPEIKAEFGEDPARFLCSEMNPEPRIRGIGDVGLLRAYRDVELEQDCRQEVVGAINRRLMELEAADAPADSAAVAAAGGDPQ